MSERRVPDAELEFYVGKNISLICDHGFISEAGHTNHCAHFLGHIMGLHFALTCGDMTNAPHKGGTLRVNEIYNRCTDRGPWVSKPTPLIYCMIFATQATNMTGGNMGTHSNKHVGIWRFPYVYNYSTMNHQVLKEEVPDFLARLNGVYDSHGTNPVQLFYGRELPPSP
jgi:hypothetical protein